VAECAQARGLEAHVLDALALAPRWFERAYVAAHLGSSAYTPTLYGGAYFASNRRTAPSESVRRSLDRSLGAALVREVRRLGPRAVVATHFYPLTVLGEARARGELDCPVVGVVTDYAAHALWADPNADLVCAPPGPAVADLVRHGVPRERIAETGIPIRPGFGRIAPTRGPEPGEPLRVLVTCGGFGVGPILRVLRSLDGLRDAVVTVVCGDNPALVRRARALAARHALDAEVVGFEPDMPARLAQAHIVVGKPGGLTVTETIAAGRPLALVGAVPGQETCNQRWLVERGAAVVLRPRRAAPALRELVARGALARMAEAARSLARPDAAGEVLAAALGACSSAPARAA
jgi:processive 1,2-diacylglycerol beta-glucosyltransferase